MDLLKISASEKKTVNGIRTSNAFIFLLLKLIYLYNFSVGFTDLIMMMASMMIRNANNDFNKDDCKHDNKT